MAGPIPSGEQTGPSHWCVPCSCVVVVAVEENQREKIFSRGRTGAHRAAATHRGCWRHAVYLILLYWLGILYYFWRSVTVLVLVLVLVLGIGNCKGVRPGDRSDCTDGTLQAQCQASYVTALPAGLQQKMRALDSYFVVCGIN